MCRTQMAAIVGCFLTASLCQAQKVAIDPANPAVESIPGKVGGAWVFQGYRENLEDLSIDEVMVQFHVTRAQITGVLDFVAQRLREPTLPQSSLLIDAHSL